MGRAAHLRPAGSAQSGRSTTQPPASRAFRSSSVRTGTPAAAALAAFEPGLSPTITAAVFFETLSETFAPSGARSASFAACSAGERLERARDHVLRAGQAALLRQVALASASVA